ncbi:putative bifunctional diguanylate cyclase/phosphodiesterase [Massilia varians]|uniref:putative bifunctional diguanylate cyclase/phosphodiesterase n=1 Tax=Massilia varians TaxID=457921 RepID=UPI002553EAF5|nr:bifunctional diguanylate cyclase/phosphodiesterase [Massilia varians]MDK6077432.1 EAL domain-containing protein [Massilia varians]
MLSNTSFSGKPASSSCSIIGARPARTDDSQASILDELRQVIFETDTRGQWRFLNRAWEALSGRPVDAALGTSCLALIHTDDRERARTTLDQLLSGQRDRCRLELRFLDADGAVRWVEVVARACLDASAAVTGTVGTLFDVSDRRAARHQRRLTAGVFSSAGEGIIITSADGLIVDVNAAFEDITGYARAEVLGRNPRLLSSGRQDKAFYRDMWRSIEQTGSWSGEVWNRRKCGEFYVERLTIAGIRDEDGALSHHVGVFADITRQKQQAQHLEHIAHYDPLTGLANRSLLADRLQQAMGRARRHGAGVAVACLDLDDFRLVNEVHGHEAGDELLVALGRRMQNAVRESDTTCRLGGDEFVVVFDGVESLLACQPLMTRLLQAIAEPVALGEARVCVSASAGLAFYPQGEDIDADQLIRQADQAMYDAKMGGKHRFCLFDSHGYHVMVARAEEVDALEGALARGEFALHYQPIVHLRTGKLNSVEALVRWNHPTRGCLPPGEFLPALEGHPLMLALENWILAEALRQHQRWLDAGLDVAVSVNMSGAQLHRKDFADDLRALLAAHPRVDPRRIKLEVLESSALEDLDHVSDLIAHCARIGVGFALDDFGTGYSSLRYLKQLPARRIKIDQGFVRDMLQDPDDLAILEGIIGMAAAFKREVVAEGVESDAHAAMLVQLGCLLAQGYGIARPMPPDALPAWLGGWSLPAVVAASAPLERDDTLLLKALVEQRAWQAAYCDGSQERPCRAPSPALQAFDEWLALRGRKQARCEESVRRAILCRDALVAQTDPVHRATAAHADAPVSCEEASIAFAAALATLLGQCGAP